MREEPRFVSGRFLNDLMRALTRSSVPAVDLVGDLPIPVTDGATIVGAVEWMHFAEFMKRLGRRVGGEEGLEACGGLVYQLGPTTLVRGMAGIAASPLALYRVAAGWALPRAMPGIEMRLDASKHGHLEIHARLAPGLRACPEIFHFAAGAARVLPRILGLPEAVVSSRVSDREAHYEIALPPSRSWMARAKRLTLTLFSAGSALHFLETQQLELHAKHAALKKAHDDLTDRENRYRALTDAADDVLCEFDCTGRILYVSPSIADLIGYQPEQVTGSHFRLWVPAAFQADTCARFEAIASEPAGRSFAREIIVLHSKHTQRVVTEVSLRSYQTSGGEWRLLGIFRDVTPNAGSRTITRRTVEHTSQHPPLEFVDDTDRRAHDLDTGLLLYGSHSTVAEKSDWIQLNPLLEKVRAAFCERPANREVTCDIDLEVPDGLEEVWTAPEILSTALASLLDWTSQHGEAEQRSGLDLRIERISEQSPSPGQASSIAFSIEARQRRDGLDAGRADGANSDGIDAAGAGDRQEALEFEFEFESDLPLAIANDAVKALDGQLAILSHEASSPEGRRVLLTLPQPFVSVDRGSPETAV